MRVEGVSKKHLTFSCFYKTKTKTAAFETQKNKKYHLFSPLQVEIMSGRIAKDTGISDILTNVYEMRMQLRNFAKECITTNQDLYDFFGNVEGSCATGGLTGCPHIMSFFAYQPVALRVYFLKTL